MKYPNLYDLEYHIRMNLSDIQILCCYLGSEIPFSIF